MKITGYLIMHPDGDRPYFSQTLPTAYVRVQGAKVFEFELEVPGFVQVYGRIQATGEELMEELEFTCPNCGSHAFSSNKLADGRWARSCNGYMPLEVPDELTQSGSKPCAFSWLATEDYGCMKPTGRFHPRTGVAMTSTRGT